MLDQPFRLMAFARTVLHGREAEFLVQKASAVTLRPSVETTRISLLLRIRSPDDRAAWMEFDSIYRPMLYRFAVSRGLSHADGEDIVQQCLAAIQEHIRYFDYDPGKGRFKGWLRTLVHRRVSNLFRQRRGKAVEGPDLELAVATAETPEEAFERLWNEEHLRHCLKLLREEEEPKTFQAFHRYVLEEHPSDQVCNDLGFTAHQLYKIKWRLTRRLQDRMKELIGDEG